MAVHLRLARTGRHKRPMYRLVAADSRVIVSFFPQLFAFSLGIQSDFQTFGLSVGLIASILVALTSVKAITDKRLEFFREAGSGYDINAFFLAINMSTTVEQGLQMLLAAIIAQWTRSSVASPASFYVAFLLLGWISVSWSLLLALVTPPKNTTVILGFFMAFLGLLFGGTTSPGTYEGKSISMLQ